MSHALALNKNLKEKKITAPIYSIKLLLIIPRVPLKVFKVKIDCNLFPRINIELCNRIKWVKAWKMNELWICEMYGRIKSFTVFIFNFHHFQMILFHSNFLKNWINYSSIYLRIFIMVIQPIEPFDVIIFIWIGKIYLMWTKGLFQITAK